MGRFRPKVRPLTLLYTLFHEKGFPFVYLLLTNGTPFTYPVYKFASVPFNCCKCIVFQIEINDKNRTFSRLYKVKNLSVSSFGPFHRPK